MPTYEYFCPNCNKTLEVVQKMHDPALETCPECSQPGIKRKISQVGIAFKGSGFYITDYARKGENEGGCNKPGGCGCKSKKQE